MTWGTRKPTKNLDFSRNYTNLSVEAFRHPNGSGKDYTETFLYHVEIDGYTILNASKKDFPRRELKLIPEDRFKFSEDLTQGELDDVRKTIFHADNMIYTMGLKSTKLFPGEKMRNNRNDR